MTIRQDIKEQWVNALRSGDYKQGTKRLAADTANGPEFCCLGVLCDLAVRSGVDIEVKKIGSIIEYDHTFTDLPTVVMDWAGLDDPNPQVPFEHEALGQTLYFDSLAEINDTHAKDFPAIADLIEGADTL